MFGKGINDGFIRNKYKDLNFQDNYLNIQNKDFNTQDNYSIKQKEIIKNQPIINVNNKSYTDAESLVEYFHGMLLSYISVEKNKGELSEQSIKLINIINDYNKQKLSNKIKINGGDEFLDGYNYDKDIEYNRTYKCYNNIVINYNYYNDVNNNNNLVHNINIYSEFPDNENNEKNDSDFEKELYDLIEEDNKNNNDLESDFEKEFCDLINKINKNNNDLESDIEKELYDLTEESNEDDSDLESDIEKEFRDLTEESNEDDSDLDDLLKGSNINKHKNKLVTKMKGGSENYGDFKSKFNNLINKNNEDDKKAFNLVIDFVNGVIYETRQKIRTQKVYEFGNNISSLLKKIIDKMIYVLYNEEYNITICEKYDDEDAKETYNNKLYQSVLSLLIMILSFKTNMCKKIYTQYNYKRFLNNINERIKEGKYLFDNNNEILLTYDFIMDNNPSIGFNGDCALNALTCVKNKDIQNWLIIKKEMIKNLSQPESDKSIYTDAIQKIINNFDSNIKNKINKNIKNYTTFINSIINNYILFNKINFDYYNDYIADNDLHKNEIEPKKLIEELKLFAKYGLIIFDILMDYNQEDYIINSMLEETKDNCINDIYDIKNNIITTRKRLVKDLEEENMEENMEENEEENEVYLLKENLTKIKEIYSEYYDIITNKINPDLFYVNMIISLLLIYHKVDYLFDEKILEIFKDDDIKKYAIRRFSNVSSHDNEIDMIRFNCKTYNNHDYLFRYVLVPSHAVLLIVDVNINDLENKKYSICDLNDLNFAVLDGDYINYEKEIKYGEYYELGDTRLTYIYYIELLKIFNENKNKLKKELYKDYINENKNEIITYKESFKENLYENYLKNNKNELKEKLYNDCVDIRKNNRNHRCQDIYKCRFVGLELINNSLKNLENEDSLPLYEDNLSNIIKTTNKDDYNKYKTYDMNINNCFKLNFYNRLEKIFKNSHINDPIKYILLEKINNNIIADPKCINDNFPYYLIKELYNIVIHKYNNGNYTENILKITNISEFYSDIIDGYDGNVKTEIYDYYNFLRNEQPTDKFYQCIIDTLTTYYYGSNNNILFSGGKSSKINNSSHNNNSIIKKILIIILIVVIIIIIILIVLYIINKYKNNKNNP